MTLTGKSLIAGEWSGDIDPEFVAIEAKTGQPMSYSFAQATDMEINSAISKANDAFSTYSQLSSASRVRFLNTIGEQILALGDDLITMACTETGLPEARIQGERGRTINQLGLFANLLEQGEYAPVIDFADADRTPLPKPDTRLGYLPLGVVGVFGASNFPLAFSTAGGDTASALAAGCPVVMKAHSSHPGTSELVASAILAAMEICNIDKGVFSLVQGSEYHISAQIVTHPFVKAVGFTGSERVGMILLDHIHQRAEPIPFYGELGSINPQFILPQKLNSAAKDIATELVSSLMMGSGQFCTSPGIWALVENDDYEVFKQSAITTIESQAAGTMLTPDIAANYQKQVALWQEIAGVELISSGELGLAHQCQPLLFSTDLTTFIQNKVLQEEIFGTCALIIRCQDEAQLLQLVTLLRGSLTASIHAESSDLALAKNLSSLLVHKVGRLIYNQMPTGVEVCASMNHGGPFPAATDVKSTSVGSNAIQRFQRPICYQNMPQELLPERLKDVK